MTFSNSPIFIIGSPRSGTTLLARMIGNHSNIFMPGETHFFDDIYSRRRKYGKCLNSKYRIEILDRLETLYERYNEPKDQIRIKKIFLLKENRQALLEKSELKEIFSYFMEIQTRYEGKKRWGNNTPRDIFNFEHIIEFYPLSKFIFCTRDIRDFLSSYKNKWKITSKNNKKRIKRLYHPIITTILWKITIRKIFFAKSKIKPTNWIFIKYENLVKSPEETLKRICDTIEEEYEEAMLYVTENNSSYGENKPFIYCSSIGKWKSILSDEETNLAQIIARKEMLKIGYKPKPLNFNIFRIALIFFSVPFSLIEMIRANAWRQKSMTTYIIKRISSMFKR